MKRAATLFRLITGCVALMAVTIPPLVRLRLAEEAAECERRRVALMQPERRRMLESQWEAHVCPRGNTPYLYTMRADSQVVVRCPNGHGQLPIPLHTWVAVRTLSSSMRTLSSSIP